MEELKGAGLGWLRKRTEELIRETDRLCAVWGTHLSGDQNALVASVSLCESLAAQIWTRMMGTIR